METPPHLLPHFRRLPPLQSLKTPTFDFYDNNLDDNYSSRNDMIQDAKEYATAWDFDANDPLPFPTSGGSSPGEATPQESTSSATSAPAPAPETAPAPVPALAAPQATTDGYAMQPYVTRAVSRSQVRSSAATDYRANRSNRTALPGLFLKAMVQQVHKLQQDLPK